MRRSDGAGFEHPHRPKLANRKRPPHLAAISRRTLSPSDAQQQGVLPRGSDSTGSPDAPAPLLGGPEGPAPR